MTLKTPEHKQSVESEPLNQSAYNEVTQLDVENNVPNNEQQGSRILVNNALLRLANEELVDTPSGLLQQIMAINYLRVNEGLSPLYTDEDVQLIMNAAAVETVAQFPSLHFNQRSVVQHDLGTASCMLLMRAPAPDVAMASLHSFWYSGEWQTQLDKEGFCEARALLASLIGEEAEILLWRYSHVGIHGQDPVALQHEVEYMKRNEERDDIGMRVNRFMLCDEAELIVKHDRVFFDSESTEKLRKRLNVLKEFAELVDFPSNLVKRWLDETRVMVEMSEMRELVHLKKLWKNTTPQINYWNTPQQFARYIQEALTHPKMFFRNYRTKMMEIDNFCKPSNTTLINMKDRYEGQLRRLLRWQYFIGGYWRTLMTAEENNDESLEKSYAGLVSKAQEFYREEKEL